MDFNLIVLFFNYMKRLEEKLLGIIDRLPSYLSQETEKSGLLKLKLKYKAGSFCKISTQYYKG